MSTLPGIPGATGRARPSLPVLIVVPWLMLASAIRFLAYRLGGVGLPLMILSDLSVFIAFLLAARGMIEWTGGRTRLGSMDFRSQLALGFGILKRVLLLLFVVWFVVWLAGARELAPHLLYGFDGIAFDQFSRIGMVWSAVLAAIVLLMLVRAEQTGSLALFASLAELGRRAAWLLPAILAIALVQFGLNLLQGWLRGGIYVLTQTPEIPPLVTRFVYFGFVFGFAAIRLWTVVAILVLALWLSYRQTGREVPALPPS